MFFLSSLRFFRSLTPYKILLALISMMMLALFPANADDNTLCWTPAQLLKKTGENLIKSRVPVAFRMPPEGTPQKPTIPSAQWVR